jgi:hypothetical protein
MNVNPGTTSKHDDGVDLVGLDFLDEGSRYTVTVPRTMKEHYLLPTSTP